VETPAYKSSVAFPVNYTVQLSPTHVKHEIIKIAWGIHYQRKPEEIPISAAEKSTFLGLNESFEPRNVVV